MEIRTLDYRSEQAGEEFVDSLHRTGFAVLRNHTVSRDLLDGLYRDWAAFFASDEKYEYLCDLESAGGDRAGFIPQQVSETAIGHTEKDLKEFFHVVTGGPIPPRCEDHIRQYQELGLAFGAVLLGWMQQHAPTDVTADLSEPLPDMLCPDASLLRILHYPPLAGSERDNARRAAAHEDINLLTILPVSDQPGLQVRDNAGNWVDVAGIEGDLVINTGDMMQEATAKFFPSTTHRVVNPGGNIDNVSRISIPFFLTARLDVVLSARYTSGSYLDERLNLIQS